MASTATRIASRLRNRTTLDELKRVLVGLGDNIMQEPRPRVRRSAPASPRARGLFINDGGVPGMLFREPFLYPNLLVSDDFIRFVMGPGAVVDRPTGWERCSDFLRFDRKAAERDVYNLRCLLALLAVAGATLVLLYTLKRLGERQRRQRRGGDLGSGRPDRDGPGPRGGWRFSAARGLIHLMDTEASVAGPCGRGGRRFARTLGLLDLVIGRGGNGGGGIDNSAGGDDQEIDSIVVEAPVLLQIHDRQDERFSINSGPVIQRHLRDITNRIQFHYSLVQKLASEREIEGHVSCVNAIPWNSNGSHLISGSDGTRVSFWSSANQELLHETDTRHSSNVFCTESVPETSDEVVVSGAGDAEIEFCSPNAVSNTSDNGTLRQHDVRECSCCPHAGSANQECCNVLVNQVHYLCSVLQSDGSPLCFKVHNCLLMEACNSNARQLISGLPFVPNLQDDDLQEGSGRLTTC